MFTNIKENFPMNIKQEAIEHCRSLLPNEGCGVFSEDKFIPFENKADDPRNKFMINDPEFDYLLMKNKIQAIIHSHNDFPHASENDQEEQRSFEIPFGIINFRKGTCNHFIFWGEGIEIEPLLKRPFFFGVFDCLSLSQDYIYQKWGQRIPTPIRGINYWKNNQSLFEDHITDKSYPVEFIDVDEAREHDFYFYKVAGSKYINHVGTLIENGRILHHFINKVSCRLPASYYQEYICSAGRYNRDWESD